MSANDQEYFDWLVSQIEIPSTFHKEFHGVFEYLHNTEFFWKVAGDDNRVQDALDLRHGFSCRFKDYVSVLEIMLVLARNLEFVAGGTTEHWMWRLVENLRLNHFYDPLTEQQLKVVDDMLQTLIWRTYDRNGNGGFFPLVDTHEDQTQVELWYQLNTYVLEIVQN